MKLNLVIDASGIFYRSLYTVGNFGTKKNEKLLSSEKSQAVFMRKLATDFSALVKSVDNVNRVIVCLDSSSWRKQIPIEHGGYKSGRKKGKEESNVDWDSFFSVTQEFTDILASHGYIMSRIKDAEADDLLFLWSRKLNSMRESVIMVTGDKDLLQVIDLHENGSWTVALDPVSQRRKVSLSQDIYDICRREVSSEDVDLFDPSTWDSSPGDVLFSLVDKNDVQIVDPIKVATMKVLNGDGGDSVPGIVSWLAEDKHGEQVIRSLSETKVLKAIEDLPPFTWRDLANGAHLETLTENLIKVSKKDLTPEEVKKTIDRNISLVVLENEIIPKSIQDSFRELVETVESSPVHLSRNAILEGTKWWTTTNDYAPKGFDFTVEDEETKSTSELSEEDKNALEKSIADIRAGINRKGSTALF